MSDSQEIAVALGISGIFFLLFCLIIGGTAKPVSPWEEKDGGIYRIATPDGWLVKTGGSTAVVVSDQKHTWLATPEKE